MGWDADLLLCEVRIEHVLASDADCVVRQTYCLGDRHQLSPTSRWQGQQPWWGRHLTLRLRLGQIRPRRVDISCNLKQMNILQLKLLNLHRQPSIHKASTSSNFYMRWSKWASFAGCNEVCSSSYTKQQARKTINYFILIRLSTRECDYEHQNNGMFTVGLLWSFTISVF